MASLSSIWSEKQAGDDSAKVANAGKALAAVYTSVAVLCVLTMIARLLTARFYGLPFNPRHALFLLLLLLLFVVRIVSDLWELGDGRLVAAGSKTWMYNLLSTGPVIVFLTIFLVLLYHLTCVLHSISLAKESLEEAYYRSVAVGLGSMERSSFADHVVVRGLCGRCRGKAFLTYFGCFMVTTAITLWVLFVVGYVATLLVKDDDQHHVSVALTVLVEAPIFVVCTLTGLGLFAFAVQLLHRLRRLKMMLTSEQAIAALRQGVQPDGRASESSYAGSSQTRATAEASSNESTEQLEQTGRMARIIKCSEVQASCSGTSLSESAVGQASGSAVARSPENLPVPCSTEVEAVLGSVFRVWAVVTACVASFLFRSACILYLFCANKQFWPCALLLPYYLISEAAPAAMLILLYLLPGVEVACRARVAVPDRSSCRASLLESEAQTHQSFSLWLRANEPAVAVDESARSLRSPADPAH